MSATATSAGPSRMRLALAFLSVYLIWGSTYLAIRFAVESIPPLSMAGARFLIAGALLFVWARRRSAERPTGAQWRAAWISGTLMLLGGNGIVSWVEQWVPSGLTALIVSSVPLWMGLMHWMVEPSGRPGPRGIAGLILGFAGVVLLVRPGGEYSGDSRLLLGGIALVLASAFWAAGSLYSRRGAAPKEPLLSTSLQMIAGSVSLIIAGAIAGEVGRFDPAGITARSVWSLAYLTIFGSIIAFTAYVWLLRATTPAKAATYAYVNPIVAVFLGAGLAGEALSGRTLIAAAIVIGAVVMITTERR